MCDSNDPPPQPLPSLKARISRNMASVFISQASQCTSSPFLVTSPTFFCVVPTSEGSEAKPHLDHISNISTEHLHNENYDEEEKDGQLVMLKYIREYLPIPNFLCWSLCTAQKPPSKQDFHPFIVSETVSYLNMGRSYIKYFTGAFHGGRKSATFSRECGRTGATELGPQV